MGGNSHVGVLDVAALGAVAVGLYYVAKIVRPSGSGSNTPSAPAGGPTTTPTTPQAPSFTVPQWLINIAPKDGTNIPLTDPRTDAPVVVSPGFGIPVLAPFFPVPIAPATWNPLDSSFPHADPNNWAPDWLDEGFYRVTHPFTWWAEGAV